MTYTHYSFLVLMALLFNSSWMQAQVTVDFTANSTTGCGSLQAVFSDQSTSTAGAIVSWAWDLGGVSSSNEDPGRIFGTPGLYDICLTATDVQGNSNTLCKSEYIQVFELPVPDFDVSQIGGCAPLNVDFIDQSIAATNIIEWIWGVGGSSGVIVDDGSLTEISSTYNLADEYTVSLTVEDENGCSNTITKTDFLSVFPDPEISISVNDTFGCNLPFVVDFTNQSNLTNIDFTWDFGNGETFSGSQPPPVAYTVSGNYTVSVFAENQTTNCRDTLILEDFIQVGLPITWLVTPESGCEDLFVKFRDQTPTTADSVLWDFGNGETSTLPNLNYTFETPGCYEVSLTRYIDDCPTTIVWPNCIEVFEGPTASFTNDNTAGCVLPHTVNFTGMGMSAAGIVNWSWDFGDQTTSTDQNPSHVYNDNGSYPIQLAIEDANGCTDTIVMDTIQIIETLALLNFDVIGGCTPYTFTLDENSNTASEITDWSWEIVAEGGNIVFTSTDENPTTTLSDIGMYDINLTVTNSLGCSSTQTFDAVIGVGNTVNANFIATPLQACINNSVSFMDLSGTNADWWIWDFGDGGVLEGIQNPTHEYVDTGFFDVTLFVFDNGCGSELFLEDYIYVAPPVGKARFDLDCSEPFTALLNSNLSIGADSVFWDFGLTGLDTDTSSLVSPMFTYSDTGCYRVAMTVFNFDSGCADTDTVPVCITDPKAQFTLDQLGGCAPLTVNVTNNSIFAESYLWSVKGGILSDSTVAMPSITFAEPGIYDSIQLVITDIHDCTDTLIFPDPVVVNGVMANFNPVPMGGCIPLTVTFDDISTSLIGMPVQWEWVIGDSLFLSNEQSFDYTFDTTGIFPVQLIVMDDQSCSDTIVVLEAVEVTRPVALFTADTISCTVDVIEFTNQSTGTDLTYLWDFGDNTTSDERDPIHNYLQQGTYSVCLTVTDPYGCDSTFCRTDYIQIADPLAAFTVDAAFADCPPLLTQFENNSTNASAFEWDFGDASGFSNLENPPHVYTIPGTYDVTLIAIATENCRDTLKVDDLVILQGPVGNFSFQIDTSCIPLKVAFTGSSADIYDYVWDFGNGNLDTTLNVISDDVNFVYNELGDYIPKLILIDDANCMRAIESPDTIHVEDLRANFIATDSILCNDQSDISLINLSTSTVPINFTEWQLEGHMPAFMNVSEPQLNYAAAGVYDVELIVGNDYCMDTLFKQNYIRVGELPTAGFDLSDTLGCAPLPVDFTNTSTSSVGPIINWDWSFGDSTTSNLVNPTHTYLQGDTFDVSLIVETDIGCLDSLTQSIVVLASPLINFEMLPSICQGEGIQLTAQISGDTTGSQFYWLSDPTLSCSQCLDPIASPLDTTIYGFVSMNSNGCEDTIDVVVNVLPFAIPDITLTQDTSICADALVQLVATGGDNVWAYQWDQSRLGLSCYEACQNPIAEPTATTVYVVTVTNASGCSAQDSVLVDVIDAFQPIAGNDRTICAGDSVQLQVSDGSDWEWLNTIGLSCTFCADPIAFPDSSTTYTVQALTSIGCTIEDTVRVNVIALNGMDAGMDEAICIGDVVELNGSGSGVLTWSPTTNLDNPSIANPMANPTVSTTFTLTAEDDLCILVDSVLIDVVDQTNIDATDLIACFGDTLQLSVDGSADQFEWTPATNISDPEIENPFVWPTETTTYTVVGQLSSCAPDTAALTIVVDETPAVKLSPIIYFVPGQPIQLQATITDDRTYRFDWSPNDSLSCSDCPNPVALLDSTSIQDYSLLVTDEATGCEIILPTRLEPLQFCPEDLIFVPNAFSPNDDGNNDELQMYSTTITRINTFKIFDRWGELVFETSDMRRSWDGDLNNQPASIGVYIYFLEAPCPIDPNQTIFIKGDVTLLR